MADIDLAASNVNRAVTLIGSSMAIFTFILFFLYPRYSSGQVDPVLFQATLTLIVLTIFSYGFSGFYNYGVVGVKMNPAKKRAYRRRGDLIFVLGLVMATAEPALILFTVGLTVVAVIATILWLLYISFVVHQGSQLAKP